MIYVPDQPDPSQLSYDYGESFEPGMSPQEQQRMNWNGYDPVTGIMKKKQDEEPTYADMLAGDFSPRYALPSLVSERQRRILGMFGAPPTRF